MALAWQLPGFCRKKGAKVALAARSKEKLDKLSLELPGSFVIPTDMADQKSVEQMIEETKKHYGKIDVLINNAGQGIYGAVENVDVDAYKKVIDLNVVGPLVAMQKVIPVMREQGGGMIINISSLVSKNYFPWLGAYASTKYALNALSLTARQELKKDKIIVCVFHPKMTATDFGKNAVGGRPDWIERSRDNRPAPEIDTPEQVAEKIIEQIKSEEAEMMM